MAWLAHSFSWRCSDHARRYETSLSLKRLSNTIQTNPKVTPDATGWSKNGVRFQAPFVCETCSTCTCSTKQVEEPITLSGRLIAQVKKFRGAGFGLFNWNQRYPIGLSVIQLDSALSSPHLLIQRFTNPTIQSCYLPGSKSPKLVENVC